MNRLPPFLIESCTTRTGETAHQVFISRRLARVIESKSYLGEWDFVYFPLKNIIFGKYEAKLIGLNRLILFALSD